MYLPSGLLLASDDAPGLLRRFADFLLQFFADVSGKLGSIIVEGYHKAHVWLLEVAKGVQEPLNEHPYVALSISLIVFFGPWILLLPLFLIQAIFFAILYILGLGPSGTTGGSPAALYQSLCYGGHTPPGSIFAMLQSTGTRYNVGTASNWVLVCIRIFAAVVGVYIILGMLT